MSPPDERTAYGVAADLLAAARPLHHASLVLLLATGLALALKGPSAALAAGILAGLVQAYLAFRIAFDAALFRRLAEGLDPQGFDAAMTGLGLLPAAKAGRPAAARAAGARRLLVGQGVALAVQAVCLVGVAVQSSPPRFIASATFAAPPNPNPAHPPPPRRGRWPREARPEGGQDEGAPEPEAAATEIVVSVGDLWSCPPSVGFADTSPPASPVPRGEGGDRQNGHGSADAGPASFPRAPGTPA